jgi:monoterpene epsilon-lactone hydrolase
MEGKGCTMASLRGRLVCSLVGCIVRRKFRRAGESIAELRRLDEFAIRNQRTPAGTEIDSVEAGGVPAEWVRAPGARPERAILYLHGGALVMGSPATHRELAARVSAVTGAAVLVPDYRLAPEHPFPAAVQDAIAVYRWLLNSGFRARRIAIGGDSAGGGLALQSLLSLQKEGIPRPAVAFLLSPVTDWVRLDGESYVTRAAVDPLNDPRMCRFTASCYVGDNDPETPLLSPIGMDLSDLPPLCIHVGEREIVLSDSERLAERARDYGVEVELRIWGGMWHVFQTAAGFVPEARRSLKEIGRFCNQRLEG